MPMIYKLAADLVVILHAGYVSFVLFSLGFSNAYV